MGVSLTKGANVSLTKEAGGTLTDVTVGLGWDIRTTDGKPFDLDASAILCGADGKVLSDQHFVFFNNKTFETDVVVHGGDNLTGVGDGDDETIDINLAKVPSDVQSIKIVVSIYEADERAQSFGQVQNAYVRTVNKTGGEELSRFDLGEDASTETALVFGEVYRNGADWKFRAIGQGYTSGLKGIATDFGVSV